MIEKNKNHEFWHNKLRLIYIRKPKDFWSDENLIKLNRRLSGDKHWMVSLNFQLKSRSPEVKLKLGNFLSFVERDLNEYLSMLNRSCNLMWILSREATGKECRYRKKGMWERVRRREKSYKKLRIPDAAQWRKSSRLQHLHAIHNSHNSSKIP